MRELTCIVCPIGCRLSVEESPDGRLAVSGNRCARGALYAEEEIRSPKRVVTATCRIEWSAKAGGRSGGKAGGGAEALGGLRRLPVRSSVSCPKEQVDELIADIYAVAVSPPIKRGAAIISNWKGRGIDVLASRSLE
jgi:CxxC motif-containing protein